MVLSWLRLPRSLQRGLVVGIAVVLAAGALGLLMWSVTTPSPARLAWLTSMATVLAVVLPTWAMSVAMLTWALRSGKASLAPVAPSAGTVVARGAVSAQALHGPGLIPRDIPGFTGRGNELAWLTGLAQSVSVMVTAISGAAGVGKTALAVHAAHQLLPQFPDGHLYANMHGYTNSEAPVEPGRMLEVFLRRLGVDASELEEQSGLLRQLLASKRVLMVLDNVATENQARPLLPGAGSSQVLITSRDTLAGLPVDHRLNLGVLPVDEATALLAAMIGPQRVAAEPQAVKQVQDCCGCLPLALWISGQILAVHPAWTVAKLAGMLAGERHRLDQLSVGDVQVQAAFAVSFKHLADSDARMFRLLGLHPGPDFDVLAAASLAGMEPSEAEPILGRLVLAHLIIEEASGRFRMHDLLRLFARRNCRGTDNQSTQDAALSGLVRHFIGLVTFLSVYGDLRFRSLLEQRAGADIGELFPPRDQLVLLTEHYGADRETSPSQREALALFEAERPNLLAIFNLAAELGWHHEVWLLSLGVGEWLMLLRHFDDPAHRPAGGPSSRA